MRLNESTPEDQVQAYVFKSKMKFILSELEFWLIHRELGVGSWEANGLLFWALFEVF